MNDGVEISDFDKFQKLLNGIKLDNEIRTVICTYKEQELLKDSDGKYYLANSIYPEHQKEISKYSAIEIEKEFKLRQVMDKKNRFFQD